MASSGNDYIDALTGYYYQGNIYTTSWLNWGHDSNITYAFGNIDGYGWLSYEKAAWQQAAQTWANVANISFTEVSTSQNPDMLESFVDTATMTSLTGGNWGGWHYYPLTNTPAQGYYNIDRSYFDSAGLTEGGYGFELMIHEIGHGLGLIHPHNDITFAGVSSDSDLGDNSLNQVLYTIMSYNDGYIGSWDANGYGRVATPMAFDIAAIQYLYGANTTYHTGDDVYYLPDGNAVGDFWSCIWDAGGTDTIVNGSSQGCMINLNSATLQNEIGGGGFVSQISNASGGFTIAFGVVIENAIGGSGNDTILGNNASNILTGNGGNDLFFGGGGIDYIYGGDDADTAVIDGASSGWEIVRFGDIVQTFSMTTSEMDWHQGVETFDFSDVDLLLGGLSDNNPFSYLAGNMDVLNTLGPDAAAAIQHYFNSGHAEGRALDSFDEWSYLAGNSDLLNAFGPDGTVATQHYVYNGYWEGRAADSFDEWSYLAGNSDLLNAFGPNGVVATQHYVYNGYWEGRAADSFDEWSYLAGNSDLLSAFGPNGFAATQHYVYSGYWEGRAADSFDEYRYIASYGDLIQTFGANGAMATQHYVYNGYFEGRVADFDAAQYLANYADLQAAYGSDLEAATLHYIYNGYYEGRTDEA